MATDATSRAGVMIRGARCIRDVPAKDLARQMNERGVTMNASKLSRIENGRQDPTASEIQVAAAILRVPVEWLFTGPDWLDGTTLSEDIPGYRISGAERPAEDLLTEAAAA